MQGIISLRGEQHPESIMFRRQYHIFRDAGDPVLSALSPGYGQADQIAHLQTQPTFDRLIQHGFVVLLRKPSFQNCHRREHLQKISIQTADTGLNSPDPVAVLQAVIHNTIPGNPLHLRPLTDQRSRLRVHHEACMPVPVTFYSLYHLRPHFHVRHAKDHRHQKHRQHNTQPGHARLLLMPSGRDGDQIQIMFHRLSPPNSHSVPSVT